MGVSESLIAIIVERSEECSRGFSEVKRGNLSRKIGLLGNSTKDRPY